MPQWIESLVNLAFSLLIVFLGAMAYRRHGARAFFVIGLAFLCFALSHAVKLGEFLIGYPVTGNDFLSAVLVIVRITGYALVVFGLVISFRR
ncbi:MAG: hypothetical protein GX421_02895 [Caldisericales bacterium]|nr:hypothetical protein [Caldisericales bacterium]